MGTQPSGVLQTNHRHTMAAFQPESKYLGTEELYLMEVGGAHTTGTHLPILAVARFARMVAGGCALDWIVTQLLQG